MRRHADFYGVMRDLFIYRRQSVASGFEHLNTALRRPVGDTEPGGHLNLL